MTQEVNRRYKDTVFRMLFSDAENALSLYNGLNGTAYTDIAKLQYNTLENAIYMNVKNDVSFLIGHWMHLYEHQSTWNPNMPLRNLMYISDVLQAYSKDYSLYGTKLKRIPTPAFYVFYNGQGQMPESIEMKLSDAFEIPVEDPALELKVRVLNINPGMNEELKKKCPVLKEYMTYVERIRIYAADMELADAVEQSVNDCIRDGVLSEFLQKQEMEVIKVSIYEYDEEREMRLIRADEREIGMEQGLEQGRQEGIRPAVVLCREFGLSKEETVQRIRKDFALSEEDARKSVENFWSSR